MTQAVYPVIGRQDRLPFYLYRHRNIRPRVPCGKGKGTCLPPVFVHIIGGRCAYGR